MSNQYLLNRITGRDPNLRAGDDDRERIAERLRKSRPQMISTCQSRSSSAACQRISSDSPPPAAGGLPICR